MTEPTPNVPLLRKVVDWAKHEAEKPKGEREWIQNDWVTPREEQAASIARRELTPEYLESLKGLDFWDEERVALLREHQHKVEARTEEILAADDFDCKTAFCIAGYVAHLEGFDFSTVRADGRDFEPDEWHTDPDPEPFSDSIALFAADKLGLTPVERALLFDGINDVDRVVDAASEIAERAGDRL